MAYNAAAAAVRLAIARAVDWPGGAQSLRDDTPLADLCIDDLAALLICANAAAAEYVLTEDDVANSATIAALAGRARHDRG